MTEVLADLHIHTCLSPCAEREMTPPAVVRAARRKGLHVIAVCDHNSAENVGATSRAGEEAGLAVIGGMEICTREEVHVLALFKDEHALGRAQDVVYQNLSGNNDPKTFGEQAVTNERGEVTRLNSRLLIGAADLSLEEVIEAIHAVGGMAIAAHVDRPSFSIISQLGFIPPELALDGVEVCSAQPPALPKDLAVIRSSDAHRLEEIGSRYTRFLLEGPTASEIEMALRGLEGRGILTGLARPRRRLRPLPPKG